MNLLRKVHGLLDDLEQDGPQENTDAGFEDAQVGESSVEASLSAQAERAAEATERFAERAADGGLKMLGSLMNQSRQAAGKGLGLVHGLLEELDDDDGEQDYHDCEQEGEAAGIEGTEARAESNDMLEVESEGSPSSEPGPSKEGGFLGSAIGLWRDVAAQVTQPEHEAPHAANQAVESTREKRVEPPTNTGESHATSSGSMEEPGFNRVEEPQVETLTEADSSTLASSRTLQSVLLHDATGSAASSARRGLAEEYQRVEEPHADTLTDSTVSSGRSPQEPRLREALASEQAAEARGSQLEAEVSELREALAQARSQHLCHEKTLSEQEQSHVQVENELAETSAAIRKMQAALDAHQSDATMVAEQLAAAEAVKLQLQSELSHLSDTTVDERIHRALVESHQEETHCLHHALGQVASAEAATVEHQTKHAEVVSQLTELEALADAQQGDAFVLVELRELLAAEEARVSELQTLVGDRQSDESALEKTREQLATEETCVMELHNRIDSQQGETVASHEAREQLAAETARASQLQVLVDALQIDCSSLGDTCKQLEAAENANDELQSELSQMKAEGGVQLNELSDAHETEVQRLLGDAVRAEAASSQLQSELAVMSARVAELEVLQSTDDGNAALLADARDQVARIYSSEMALQRELSQKCDEVQSLEEAQCRIVEEEAATKTAVREQTAALNAAQVTNSELEAKYSQILNEFHDCMAQVNSQQAELETAETDSSERVASAEATNAQLRSELAALKVEAPMLDELRDQAASAAVEEESLRAELTEAMAKLQQQATKAKDSETAETDSSERVASTEATNAQLRSELAALKVEASMLDELRDQAASAVVEKESLGAELTEAMAKLQQQTAKTKDSEMVQDSNRQLAELREEVLNETQAAKAAEARSRQAESHLRQAKVQEEELRKALSAAREVGASRGEAARAAPLQLLVGAAAEESRGPVGSNFAALVDPERGSITLQDLGLHDIDSLKSVDNAFQMASAVMVWRADARLLFFGLWLLCHGIYVCYIIYAHFA